MDEAGNTTRTASEVEAEEQPDLSPEALAARLGPFGPPAGFTLGEEFEAPAPRPIPAILKRGSYRRKADRHALTLLVFGALCSIYSSTRIVEELSYYLLPLGYLEWIGYGLSALAVGSWLCRRIVPGRYAYVIDGLPVPARVLRTSRVLEKIQGRTQLRFEILLEFKDPVTGKLACRSTLTDVINGIQSPAKFDLALEPGEYLTAVGKPGRFEETLAAYPVLGLHPDQEVILYRGRPWTGMSIWGALSLSLLFMLILALPLGLLYTVQFCMPEENFGPGGLGAGLGCVLALAAGLAVARRRGEKCASKKSLQAGLLGALLGAGGGFMTAALVNSAFDTSPPEYREVQVLEFWQTTHSFLFRDYSIEYRAFPDGKREKVAARVEKMQAFGVRLGALEIGGGALGMRWIRDIHPLQFVLLPAGEAEGDDRITFEVEGEDGTKQKGSFRAFFPTIPGGALKPSPRLLAEAGRQFAAMRR